MKRALLTSAAFLGLSAGAMAADLGVVPPPVAPVAAPVFTWTGFYVGANAGYGWSDNNRNVFADPGLVAPSITGGFVPVVPQAGGFFGQGVNAVDGGRRSGFVGGGQVGYNFQFGAGAGVVLGVEADIQWADLGRHRGFSGNAFNSFGTAVPRGAGIGTGVAPVGLSVPLGFNVGAPGNVAFFNNSVIGDGDDRSDWFGTARLRLGYAFDRLLVYGTGGMAFTDHNRNNLFVGNGFTSGAAIGQPFYVSPAAATRGAAIVPTGGVAFGGQGDHNIGWAAGGGIEYAITANLSVKLEGLWADFGSRNAFSGCCTAGQVVGVTNTGAPVIATNTTVSFRSERDDVAVVRAGLNWRFSL